MLIKIINNLKIVLEEIVIPNKLTVDEVKADFENLINLYCEQVHLDEGIPRNKLCNIMVERFGDVVDHNPDWMRKKIDMCICGRSKDEHNSNCKCRNYVPRFKVINRVKNGTKKGGLSTKMRIKAQIKNLEDKLADIMKEQISYVGNN